MNALRKRSQKPLHGQDGGPPSVAVTVIVAVGPRR
jgi:hypothetical protein